MIKVGFFHRRFAAVKLSS